MFSDILDLRAKAASSIYIPNHLLNNSEVGVSASSIRISKLPFTNKNYYEPKDKWYLKDLCLLGLVHTLFTISKDVEEDKLLLLHKNKHRKEIKNITTISNEYIKLRDKLVLALNKEDGKKLSRLTRSFAPIFFNLARKVEGINLEIVCVNIMIARFQKRTNLHNDFKICKDFKNIFKIVEEVEKIGMVQDEGTKEYLFASQIVQKINEHKL